MVYTQKKYDLAFVGVGAANSLIIKSLNNHGLLKNRTIAIFEPDPKTINDKTYCFWATEEELNQLNLNTLIDQSWSKLHLQNNTVDLAPLKYFHVSSLKLYNHVKEILSTCKVDVYNEHILQIEHHNEDDLIELRTESATIQSILVFDSRPAEWQDKKDHQTFLWQSFLGWKIQTNELVLDEEEFTMMDFEVDQANATQFVYILPYSRNHALVELTRFGNKMIDHSYARQELAKYCLSKNWEYSVLEEEIGMIPMSTLDIKPRSLHKNHIVTGTAAGKLKPTTGYAFKEMAQDALIITEILSQNLPFTKHGVVHERKGKFAFYDRILLKILDSTPENGKQIFTNLFSQVDSKLVLKFLEQKTRFTEDIQVFKSMPKLIFIQGAIADSLNRFILNIPKNLPLILTLVFLCLHSIGLQSVSIGLLLIGMFVIGIPHGAMDHLLDKKSTESLPKFIITYLFKGAIVLAIWKLSPEIALAFFILYSAWHFGQADFIQWNLKTGIFSFLWGIGLLLFLLFSHAKQTAMILSQILDVNSVQFMLKDSNLGTILSLALMIYSLIISKKSGLILSLLMLILASFLPLIEAFGIYFICQHSMNGWNHLKSEFQKSNFDLWKSAAPFTLGAVVLFIFFFSRFNINWNEQMGTFFIFLSCISFPHVLSMDHFYKQRK